MKDYGAIEQEQEDAGFAACAVAFAKAYPKESPDAYEMCDGGSWGCSECPWKETAAFHPHNFNRE